MSRYLYLTYMPIKHRVSWGVILLLLLASLPGSLVSHTGYAQQATPIVEPTPTPEPTATSTPEADECIPTYLVVEMTPVDFGTLKWNGESWGASNATSTITVTNPDTCVTELDYSIDLQINASPGMTPVVVSVTSNGHHVVTTDTWDAAAGTLAEVPAGFTDKSTLEVEFLLSPNSEVGVGDHAIEFVITVNPAP